MSPMTGTFYSDSINQVVWKVPGIKHGIHEVLELLRQRWSPGVGSHSQVGTDSWEDQSVEWLQTSILTELEGTPCRRISQSASIPDIQTPYIRIVRDLVSSQALEHCNRMTRYSESGKLSP